MSDDELNELYWAKPDDFIALRTELSGSAKRRGDQDTAKRISATNKPTIAAWVVNRLAIGHREVGQRIADLGDRLRAAHAAMDGDLIRDLSAEQRKLINELTRTAFEAAEVSPPSAAVRDDVTATLQAAVADPDVLAGLRRLTRPERWSGFGAFGQAAPVATADRDGKAKTPPGRARSKPATGRQRNDKLKAVRQQEEKLTAALTEAERARAAADDALSERQAELAEAQSRHAEARNSLRAAERALSAAERAYEKAQQLSRSATDRVKQTKARLGGRRGPAVRDEAAGAPRPGRRGRSSR